MVRLPLCLGLPYEVCVQNSRKTRIDMTTRQMHLVLDPEAFETAEVKLDETTEAADHSVTQEAILPTGYVF